MTSEQKKFLLDAAAAADRARHIFPEMAACEAALESAFGRSLLAIQDSNLFGLKSSRHSIYGTHVLPTREFENGEWIQTSALWVHYPGWATCFFDRMATLNRLSSFIPNYKAALDAKDAKSFVISVSESWSTDPGWQCSCGLQFPSAPLAAQHAIPGPEHAKITVVPGLGRALKVIAIFNSMDGQWSPVSDLALPAPASTAPTGQ